MFKGLVKISDYFSRKFILASSSLVGGFYLVLEGKDVNGFTGLVLVILGTYAGANVAELASNMKARHASTSTGDNQGNTTINVDTSSGT